MGDIDIRELRKRVRKGAGYAQRLVITATRRSEATEVRYGSISGSEPRWRWMMPRAICFYGFLWHTRTCCPTDHSFKDFLFCRIIKTRASLPSEVAAEADARYQQVTLKTGSHPELSDTQQKVIAPGYGLLAGRSGYPAARLCPTRARNCLASTPIPSPDAPRTSRSCCRTPLNLARERWLRFRLPRCAGKAEA